MSSSSKNGISISSNGAGRGSCDNLAYQLALQRYSIFYRQNFDEGCFDVTFQFKDKQLHAHSFVLWSISNVFKSMLFGPFANKDPIPIVNYSFEDFKEFLTFLYLGKCKITSANVMTLVDLSEFYGIILLKDKCDEELVTLATNADNVLKVYESLKTYSLDNSLNTVLEYIANNTEKCIKSEQFNKLKKETIMDIIKMEHLTVKEEVLFEAIYKWAEYQSKNNIKALKIDDDINKLIKSEMEDILPYIHFPIMSTEFLHDFVIPKGYLFHSFDEISKILRDATVFAQKGTISNKTSSYSNKYRGGKRLQFTDGEGCKAYAIIHDHLIIEKLEKSLNKMAFDGYDNTCYWDIILPEVESGLDDAVELLKDVSKYYVVRDRNATLALKYLSKGQSAYCFGGMGDAKVTLITEVFLESQTFLPGYGCKFEME